MNQIPNISFEKFSTHESGYNKLLTFQRLSNISSVAIEQNNEIILQQLRLQILKGEYLETVLMQDNRYCNYSRQFDRLSVIDEIVPRQYFDETGFVKYNQVLLPKHLVTELL